MHLSATATLHPGSNEFAQLQKGRQRIRSQSLDERVTKLKRLKQIILDSADELREAVRQDYAKHSAEVDLSELFTTMTELNLAISKLKKWARPRKVGTPLALLGTKSEIRFQPKGIALIIGPWNYPFSLVMIPLISAVAAGNSALVKPSELTNATSRFIKKIIAAAFDEDEITAVEGGAEVSQALLTLPFDHIFFTGSTRVGKLVAEAAAKNLATVTLELGGKSPVVIDESADLKVAANRIAWGKFLNAGQTCVAPDYVMVPKSKASEFISELKTSISGMLKENSNEPRVCSDLCQIIDESHYQRLKKLVADSIAAGARLEGENIFLDKENKLSPTLLSNVSVNSPIMKEEIFGPILPILTYETLEEVCECIQSGGTPLAMYIFSSTLEKTEQLLKSIDSGGVCVNNTLIHLLNPNLPFGGMGPSGMGSYHGQAGFRAFSHERSVMYQRWGNPVKLMYPPYNSIVQKIIRIAVRFMT